MNTQVTQPLNELDEIRHQNATFRKPFLRAVELRPCPECVTKTNHHLYDTVWVCVVCLNLDRNGNRRFAKEQSNENE